MEKPNEKTNLDEEIKPRMHGGATHHLFQNARELRERMTLAESMLWEELKMKKLDGFKFRRQHPVGIHILDFYCHSKKLGIELDGGYHDDKHQKLLDGKRTEILNQQNIKIIRFQNTEVINQMGLVLEKILIEFETPDP